MAEESPAVPQPLPTLAESTTAIEEPQAAHENAGPAATASPEADPAVQFPRININGVLQLTYSSRSKMIHFQTSGTILQTRPHSDPQSWTSSTKMGEGIMRTAQVNT